MAAPPEGWHQERTAWGEVLWLAPGVEAGEVPEPGAGRTRSEGVSRGGVRRVETTGGALWIREYRRGGALAHLMGDRYLSSRRGLREAALLQDLHRAGLPVPEPLFLGITSGIWVRMRLGTRESSGRPLTRVLRAGPHERRAAMRGAGSALRRLHDAGIRHGDLHLDNILWDGARAVLLDLDHARRAGARGGLDRNDRWRELMRLLRSARKRRRNLACSSTDALRLLAAYAGEDVGPWIRELRTRLPELESRLRWHGLLWSR